MISAVPYALQNGSHSADLFRQATSSLVPPSGGLVTLGDLNVTQTGTASMNVVVGVGRAWVPGTNVGNVTGGNFSKQAMYFALNDAAYTASVTTSDPTNPRIDVVYLAVNDSQYAGTTDSAVLAVATGVPAAGATYPANAPTIPANAIALAWINVPALAASISNGNITNIAVPYSLRRGVFTGNYGVTPSTLWGPGPLTKVTASSPNGSGFTSPANDTITLPGPGLYGVTWRMNMSSSNAGGATWGSLRDGSGNEYSSFDIASGNGAGTVAYTVYAPTQQNLTFKFWTTTSGITLTSKIEINKWV